MKKALSILSFFLLAFVACKKDDEPNSSDKGSNSSQLSLISESNLTHQKEIAHFLYNGALKDTSYTATIDGIELTAIVTSDSTLALSIPDITPGNYNLNVPGLNENIEISIQETTLEDTPENILNSLTSALESELTTLETDSSSSSEVTPVDVLSEVIESSSEEEKIAMAKFYNANKEAFDAIMSNEYNNLRTASNCIVCTSANIKFSISVLVMGGGVAVAWLAPDIPEKVIASAVAYIGFKKAKVFGLEITNEKLLIISSAINKIESKLNGNNIRTASTEKLTLTNDEAIELSFEINNRTLNATDRSNTAEGSIYFFESFDSFNSTISRLNSIINTVNSFSLFSKMDNIPSFGFNNGISGSEEVSGEMFSNFSISTSNPNIVVSSVVTTSGLIDLKLTGANTSFPLEGDLILTYSDEFNNATFTIPFVLDEITFDCNNVENGTASIDECGVCSGGDTGIEPNSSCKDCNNDVNGSAYLDGCNRCVGGNTGLDACVPVETETDSLGNQYSTVKIGNQTWMTENLSVTTYNDGTPIENITSDADWGFASEGAWSAFDNNDINIPDAGLLYNWHTVNTGKLCPAGWRVPSKNDWQELLNHVNSGIPAFYLKDTEGWMLSSNGNGNNKYGFSATPGGSRSDFGTFESFTSSGFWWTSDEGSPGEAWFFQMNSSSTDVNSNSIDQEYGMSVRCVR